MKLLTILSTTTVFAFLNSVSADDSYLVPLNIEETAPSKPIMYTFISEDSSTTLEDVERFNTPNDVNFDLLEEWDKQWESQGWTVVVLGLNNAKLHPRFNEFETKLQQIADSGVYLINKMTYYRYLAMSTVGGGFYSNYDIMPMNTFVPDEYFGAGKFTMYSATRKADAGTPSIMSGSADEWERMAFEIIENGIGYDGAFYWSDMKATFDIYKSNNNAYDFYDYTAPVAITEWTDENCAAHSDKIAAHFSRNAMRMVGMIDASEIAGFAHHWVQSWRSACVEPTIPLSAAVTPEEIYATGTGEVKLSSEE